MHTIHELHAILEFTLANDAQATRELAEGNQAVFIIIDYLHVILLNRVSKEGIILGSHQLVDLFPQRSELIGSYSHNILRTDLECPLGQGRTNLPSPPVCEAFKERLEPLVVNTLVLYERKLRRSILGVWVAMVTS